MKEQLYGLQSLSSFRQQLAQELDDRISPYDFWAPGTEWLKDAICAKWFAEKTAAKKVGLIAADQPDFEVQYHTGLRLRFEATHAGMPGRKMALEEKLQWNSGQSLRMDAENNWRARREAVPAALEAASKRKLENALKGLYGPGTNLLIYLNLGTFDYWRDEIERELVEHTKLVRPHFNAVWVLWSSRLYRTWPEPFLGSPGAFRPRRHELGKAVNFCRSKKSLDDVFVRRDTAGSKQNSLL
jgi:hypothetical protein